MELMKNAWDQILASYLQYEGNGKYAILFVVAMLYVYVQDSKKEKMAVFFTYPLIALTVIYNPLVAYIVVDFSKGSVYWRMFWILPITAIIAYAATSITLSVSLKSKQMVVVISLIVILIVGGKFIYTKENYALSSNWYKLPAKTIEVCDILEKDTTDMIRVVVPSDLLVSMRQYDANIQMPYGRDGYDNTTLGNDAAWRLFLLMEQSELDVDAISQAMKHLECNYLVLGKNSLLLGNLDSYGYHCIASTDEYNIYRYVIEEA